MKNHGLYQLFIEELEEMYDAERELSRAIPGWTHQASSSDFKQTLHKNLKETEAQVKRLEKVFSLLHLHPEGRVCEAMRGLLRDSEGEMRESPATLDAAIICSILKIEHYEMAAYRTLISLARHLHLESQILDLLMASLSEEKAADSALFNIVENFDFGMGSGQHAANQ